MDEAAFVVPGMYFEFLFPIWSVGHVFALLISSPPRPGVYSPFLELLNKRHPKTGEKLVCDFIVDGICKSCKKKTEQKECRHMLRRYWPDHKSADKMDIAKLLYPDQARFEREFLGQIADGKEGQMDNNYLRAFFDREPYIFTNDILPKFIITTEDPNTKNDQRKSEKGSEMTLISSVIVNGQYVIIAMDSYPTNTVAQVQTLLEAHIFKIRSNHIFNRIPIYFCCERNQAHESGWSAKHVQMKFLDLKLVYEKEEGDYGWWTTREKKKNGLCCRI